MIRSSIANTKNNLSALLQRVREGETVEITDRGKPVARITASSEARLDSHLQEMVRRGQIRLPLKPYDPSCIQPVPLDESQSARLMEIWAEERDGR